MASRELGPSHARRRHSEAIAGQMVCYGIQRASHLDPNLDQLERPIKVFATGISLFFFLVRALDSTTRIAPGHASSDRTTAAAAIRAGCVTAGRSATGSGCWRTTQGRSWRRIRVVPRPGGNTVRRSTRHRWRRLISISIKVIVVNFGKSAAAVCGTGQYVMYLVLVVVHAFRRRRWAAGRRFVGRW
jgi:hypothetical protein